mmetsp:Transcript_105488/g.330501  ORF Transcript_105488/g.330501 Transcript_105488/m.330501 type:complete len:605 (+) Transcript_105488:55-1869(+)
MVFLEFGLQLGDHVVGFALGQGRGGAVFSASRKGDPPERPTAAVKWPTNDRELNALLALHSGKVPCLGVPRVHASGVHQGQPWMALDLLGPSLFQAMGHTMAHNWRHSAPQRWQNICVVGRLLLRRLKAIHDQGFVHCDIQPENILIGRRGAGTEAERWRPFLIDFGLAHPCAGGAPVQGHAGTLEYNSVRSADGGVRLPRDDVEALGWVLCYFVVGDLPWFGQIKSVDWGDKPQRAELCQRVQRAKLQFLGRGPESLERTVPDAPGELAEYLRLCRRFGGDGDKGEAARPDYDALARLLGGSGLGGEEAEREDATLLRQLCEGGRGTRPAKAPGAGPRHFVVGTWNGWGFEEMAGGRGTGGRFRLEVHLLRDGGEFQIVRDKDWRQVLYPDRKLCGREEGRVLGPGAGSHGFNWAVEARAGDVVAIELDLRAPAVSWHRLRHDALPKERLAVRPRKPYHAVGSWDGWSKLQEMSWNGECLRCEVELGATGREGFQILEGGDWRRKLHPSVKAATHSTAHTLMGPEEHGHGKNWVIGQHLRDRAAPGARYELRLLTVDGTPYRVDWVRLSTTQSADEEKKRTATPKEAEGRARPCAGGSMRACR